MKKYYLIFRQKLLAGMAYRYHRVWEFFRSMIPVLILIAIWRRITLENGTISGYTFEGFVTYYILMLGLNIFSASRAIYLMQNMIRMGQLSGDLLKPYSFNLSLFSQVIGTLVVDFASRIPMFLILTVAIPFVRQGIHVSPVGIVLVLLYSGLALVFNFFWELTWGEVSFVTEETSGLNGMLWSLGNFLSGKIIPLDLLGPVFTQVLLFLPFANSIFLPVKYLMGELDPGDLVVGAVKLILWTVVFFLISKLIWYRGVKRYEGVGI